MIEKFKQTIKRITKRLPGWKKTGTALVMVFHMLPGLLSYSLEVISLLVAGVLITHSMLAMLSGDALYAFMLAALAVSMVALAILTDYYASSESNKGGE